MRHFDERRDERALQHDAAVRAAADKDLDQFQVRGERHRGVFAVDDVDYQRLAEARLRSRGLAARPATRRRDASIEAASSSPRPRPSNLSASRPPAPRARRVDEHVARLALDFEALRGLLGAAALPGFFGVLEPVR